MLWSEWPVLRSRAAFYSGKQNRTDPRMIYGNANGESAWSFSKYYFDDLFWIPGLQSPIISYPIDKAIGTSCPRYWFDSWRAKTFPDPIIIKWSFLTTTDGPLVGIVLQLRQFTQPVIIIFEKKYLKTHFKAIKDSVYVKNEEREAALQC